MLRRFSLIISVILLVTLLQLALLKEYSLHNVGRGRLRGGLSWGGGTCALGLLCGGTSTRDPSLVPWEMDGFSGH